MENRYFSVFRSQAEIFWTEIEAFYSVKNEKGSPPPPKQICRCWPTFSFCNPACYGYSSTFFFSFSPSTKKYFARDGTFIWPNLPLTFLLHLFGKKERENILPLEICGVTGLCILVLWYLFWSYTFRRIICCEIWFINLTNKHSTKMAMLRGGEGRLQATPVCAISHMPSVRATSVPGQGFQEVQWTSVSKIFQNKFWKWYPCFSGFENFPWLFFNSSSL